MQANALQGLEGRIQVQVALNAGRVADVGVTSTRKVQACRVLEGRAPGEALQLVPLLFSVCRTAQTQAATAACEQAMGRVPGPAERVTRNLLVLLETLHEHCRTVLVDWPLLMDEAPDVAGFACVREALRDIQRELAAAENALAGGTLPGSIKAFGGALHERLEIDEAALVDEAALRTWARAGSGPAARLFRRVVEQGLGALGRSSVEPLPHFHPGDLDAALSADRTGELAARPCWQGCVYETGPLARMHDHPLLMETLLERYGNGLLTRLVARLLELLALPQRMAESLELPAPDMEACQGCAGNGTGIGLGVVEAARGRLVHRVEVADGKVVRYQILAPTEWNFHPEGALKQGLLGMAAPDPEACRRHVTLLVAALDPCVAYEVKVQ